MGEILLFNLPSQNLKSGGLHSSKKKKKKKNIYIYIYIYIYDGLPVFQK